MNLEISPPVTISLIGPNIQFELDPYIAQNTLAEIDERFPSASQNDSNTARYLAELLDCDSNQIAVNQVRDFRELIIATCKRLDEERKKKITSIAS